MTDEINLAMVIEKLRKGVCRRVTEGRPAVVVDIEETERFMGSVADILALLTARPLALEGQHSGGECDACKRGEVRHFSTDDGFWIEITTSAGGANEHGLNGWFETLEHYPDGSTKRREYVAMDSPALATTPARAEAQDEGAAGWFRKSKANPLNDDWYPVREEEVSDLQRLGYEVRKLYAHPSPTPAADADRVRIAVELINAEINAPLTGSTHGAWDRGRIAGLKEALAALKSSGVEK